MNFKKCILIIVSYFIVNIIHGQSIKISKVTQYGSSKTAYLDGYYLKDEVIQYFQKKRCIISYISLEEKLRFGHYIEVVKRVDYMTEYDAIREASRRQYLGNDADITDAIARLIAVGFVGTIAKGIVDLPETLKRQREESILHEKSVNAENCTIQIESNKWKNDRFLGMDSGQSTYVKFRVNGFTIDVAHISFQNNKYTVENFKGLKPSINFFYSFEEALKWLKGQFRSKWCN